MPQLAVCEPQKVLTLSSRRFALFVTHAWTDPESCLTMNIIILLLNPTKRTSFTIIIIIIWTQSRPVTPVYETRAFHSNLHDAWQSRFVTPPYKLFILRTNFTADIMENAKVYFRNIELLGLRMPTDTYNDNNLSFLYLNMSGKRMSIILKCSSKEAFD